MFCVSIYYVIYKIKFRTHILSMQQSFIDLYSFFRRSDKKLQDNLIVKTFDFLSNKKIDLYRPQFGYSLDVQNIAADFYSRRTKFNLGFYDFNDYLVHLLNSTISQGKRIKRNTDILTVLEFEDADRINKNFSQIKPIANKNLEKISDKERQLYKASLEDLCAFLSEKVDWSDVEGVIVPLNGGALIANGIPFPASKLLPFECKRVPLKKRGEVGLGMNIEFEMLNSAKLTQWMDYRLRTFHQKKIKILEVAVATSLTTAAFMLELYERGIKPSEIEIVAPVMTQQGIETLQEIAALFNCQVKFIAAKLTYNVGDYWGGTEDSVLYDDKSFVIGKATKILSSTSNFSISHNLGNHIKNFLEKIGVSLS